MTTANDDAAAARAPAIIIRRLAQLQRITLEAMHCASERELAFLIVNQTAGVLPYSRATLWNIAGRGRLMAVSGRDASYEASPACNERLMRVESTLSRSTALVIPPRTRVRRAALCGCPSLSTVVPTPGFFSSGTSNPGGASGT